MVNTLVAIGTISILFGVLCLAFPKFLRYVVGIYFIITGALFIAGSGLTL